MKVDRVSNVALPNRRLNERTVSESADGDE